MSIPRYAELPYHDELKARHCWGVFGSDDQLGRVNLLTEEVRAAAGQEIRRGAFFNLSLPLDEPEPNWSTFRKPYVHTIFSRVRNTQDDYLDSFYLQRSTQWDSLRHVAAREFGFYNGVSADEAGPHGAKLGIDNWARHGMVSRGVLADVARRYRPGGETFDPRTPTPISADTLRSVLDEQGVQLRSGDVLMVHTGYIDAYLRATPQERATFPVDRDTAGLLPDEAMAEFLWDSGVVAIAADNPAVEVVPGDPAVGSLHRRLIPLLGFALGELFDLSRLAEDCAADGRYTCFFAGVPLNLPGGVGSPANAIAIK